MRRVAGSWPEPSAMGTLAQRPAMHLLVHARDRALTGTLVLDDERGDVGLVVVARGRVVKVRADKASAYFGAIAYELGFVDAGELDATLRELAAGKRRHGEILTARGALRREQLATVLEEQALRKLTHLFGLPDEATFAFYELHDALPGWPIDGPRVDPFAAVWRGVRLAVPRAQLDMVLARLGDTSWRLAPSAPIASFAFDPETVALAEVLRTPVRIPHFIAGAGRSRGLAERLVYFLALTKSIEPVERQAVPPRSSRPPPRTGTSGTYVRTFDILPRTTPPPETPILSRADIVLRASRLVTLSLYAVLGVESTATTEQIRAAFSRMGHAWRPERLPPDCGDLRDLCAAVYARMEQAHRTLTDAELRSRYDLLGAKETRPAARIDPELVFREAEIALARKDHVLAAALAGAAHDLAPDEARYEALRVWAESFGPIPPKRDPESHLRELVMRLDRVLDGDAECRSALMYRARFLKRLGDEHTAHRDFARLALLEPNNIEALREVRLYRMRHRR